MSAFIIVSMKRMFNMMLFVSFRIFEFAKRNCISISVNEVPHDNCWEHPNMSRSGNKTHFLEKKTRGACKGNCEELLGSLEQPRRINFTTNCL